MRNNYAGFAVRFFAWLTDALIMCVPLAILRGVKFSLAFYNPAAPFVRPVLFHYSPLDILIYALPVVYFSAMTLSQGATLGKLLLNLEVVSVDGKPLTFWQVLLREVVGRYLSAFAFIGYWMIVPDAEKRSLHDRIADTRVVYASQRQPVRRPASVAPPAPPGVTLAKEPPSENETA